MYFPFRRIQQSTLRNKEISKRLSWYIKVMMNKRPAKYLICKRIPIETDLKENEEKLWDEHDKKVIEFKKVYNKIATGDLKIEELTKPKKNLLDLKIELTKRMLTHCNFCERRCNINRSKGLVGYCQLDKNTYVSSWFHHWGEETPLIPSGTIFFSSCNFKCVFCQNYDISQLNPHGGIKVTEKELAKIEKRLRREGARNINFVGGEPTPNLHTIIGSLKFLEENVPLLWNSNMYCSEETMKILLEIIDIALPDFKYGNDNCGESLSNAKNYFEIVARNHKIMHDYPIDMIIRHLVIPNHLECCTKPILKWISKEIPRALVNIMRQYRPEFLVRYTSQYKEINRRVTEEEMKEAYKYAEKVGVCYKPIS